MPRIKASDIELHHEVQGVGEPLLLIMGFGASSAAWRPELVEELARAFQVITFDNRGTGQSDKPDEPYTLAMLADDAAGLLDALDIASAHVFGVSMGGMIAQEFALRHPGKVRGLVLGCTNCGAPVSVPASQETVSLLMIPEGMDPRAAAERTWPAVHTPEFIAANRELLLESMERALVHPTPLYARNRQMQAIGTWNSHERLAQLTAPALIITGDRDVLIPPQNSNILHERIRGSRLHIIPDAGHSFTSSHPEEAARVVTEFLASVAVPAGDA
jgi:pimeloyl-ACP methyl ester carboxylesterase